MPLASKNLADIVTLSRASARTRTNSAGVLTTLASGIFGIDYDPATLTVRGMPVEEQRTNITLRNQTFSHASWIKANVTVTDNTTTAPDGTLTASTLTATASGAGTNIQQTQTGTSGIPYAVSWYVKRKTGTGDVYLRSVENANTVIAVTSDWKRFDLPTTSTTTTIRCGIGLAVSGDEVYIWGAQTELGAFASSYMGETTTAAITRLADSLTIGTLSPWFNATEGTLFVQVLYSQVPPSALFPNLCTFSDGTNNETIGIYSSGSTNINGAVRDGAVAQGVLSVAGQVVAGTPLKLALSVKANDLAFCSNGGTVQTDVAATLPTVDRLYIGASSTGTGQFGHHIQKIIYYPAVKNTQTLTA